MSQRSFGSEIGNTTDTMTASNSSADVSLVKHTKPTKQAGDQMEKEAENGKSILRLPKPLAVEVYSKIHNSTLSKDDLLDEIEDLIDEKYYVGETLISAGKEYEVVSSERKGGLTIYTMQDGTKIGHRDLRRKKGLSIDEIKQIAMEDVEMIDKVWKVKEELLKECPIRETKKFAPIFSSANRRASGVTASPATSSTAAKKEEEESSDEAEADSDIEEIKEDGADAEEQNGTPRRAGGRITGGPAGSTSRRILEKKKEKERLEKERMERKEKEKEERLRKKEEEKVKKQQEKEDKLKEKEEKQARKAEKADRKSNGAASGSMDRFVKKENGTSNGETAAIFSPSKWGEKRTAIGVKKVDDAWKKRDLEAFNEACSWCEKNLSGNQRNSIENPTYKFAVQRTIDRSKDRTTMKGMKWAKKAEYKTEMAEKRKEQYSKFEPIIKAWFSEDIALDDLVVTADHLDISTHSKRMDCDEELLKCMEIAQYFVSMRKILLWNENISAEQLRADLHNGLEGFKRSTYKMIANLLETALQEKEYEKSAHCNARLSEFPITEHTITELVRAFFIGNEQMSYKRDANKRGGGGGAAHEDDEEEDLESEEKPAEIEPEEEPEQPEEKPEENDPEAEVDTEKDEEEAQKVRILALFTDPTHIYEWSAHAQIELLYALKEVVHGLPIIREWYLKDANSEQLTGLKLEATKISKKIEKAQQELADLPSGEITDDMSRNQTREMEKVIRKRQQLEKTLDELKDEMEENREAAARERDDLERIFRVTSIGNDRHLRKYYWFAYSSDAGIWVQDFGTTSYEKWVRDCCEKGFMDVETLEVENRPEYEDLPITSSQSTEIWYKLDTEAAVRHLLTTLRKNGKREKQLKKYISNNLDDILASIEKKVEATNNNKAATKKEKEEGVEQDDDVEMKEDVESASSTQEDTTQEEAEKEEDDVAPANRFTGPFRYLKLTMMELLGDWQLSGITKIVDTQQFENKLVDANELEEMKVLVIELVSSIPESCLIEKFPGNVAIAKKCFSHLKMNRFRNRVNEATNSSCLHLLLAYFDARIDQQKTITEMPCQVCRRKQGNRKLMCKQCAAVYHIHCHRPTIGRELYEEEGFKEGWWCAKCTKEDRRRQLAEAKEKREQEQQENGGGSDGSGESDQEDEEMMMMEEEESTSRGRSAKRKANAAMRDVLEFEGVLRHTPAPPPPKKVKKSVMPEVQELFNSIEKANPRLYKTLQQIPSQSRSTRNSHHETRSLTEIEEDLDVYQSAEQLHTHLTQFFQQARGYVETHNPRKLEELESLISELNFI